MESSSGIDITDKEVLTIQTNYVVKLQFCDAFCLREYESCDILL